MSGDAKQFIDEFMATLSESAQAEVKQKMQQRHRKGLIDQLKCPTVNTVNLLDRIDHQVLETHLVPFLSARSLCNLQKAYQTAARLDWLLKGLAESNRPYRIDWGWSKPSNQVATGTKDAYMNDVHGYSRALGELFLRNAAHHDVLVNFRVPDTTTGKAEAVIHFRYPADAKLTGVLTAVVEPGPGEFITRVANVVNSRLRTHYRSSRRTLQVTRGVQHLETQLYLFDARRYEDLRDLANKFRTRKVTGVLREFSLSTNPKDRPKRSASEPPELHPAKRARR